MAKRRTPQKRPARISAQSKLLAALMSAALPKAVVMGRVPGEWVEFDHDPALGKRIYDEATGKYTPDADDPEFITPRTRSDHSLKTNGRKHNRRGADKFEISRTRGIEDRRLEEEREAKAAGLRADLAKPKPRKSTKPRRRIQSRGFDKRSRPMRRPTARDLDVVVVLVLSAAVVCASAAAWAGVS